MNRIQLELRVEAWKDEKLKFEMAFENCEEEQKVKNSEGEFQMNIVSIGKQRRKYQRISI
jgi:hypothetical protein